MSVLAPLGFLGLLGIAVLILIYLLKPNFQQKIVSSTYVWKLSLKYRKKKLPINRFRNILIFICQLLIITSCAFILAQPAVLAELPPEQVEKIAIIDASANMQAKSNNETRFERAVSQVERLADEVYNQNGLLTVILADTDASFLVQRAGAEMRGDVLDRLGELVLPTDSKCSYGSADVDGAMALAEEILQENAKAEVLFYTGTSYIFTGDVTVRDVSQGGEWNAAILDCRTVYEENSYTVEVDVACYGRNSNLELKGTVYGVSDLTGGTKNLALDASVRCDDDAVKTVVFGPTNLEPENENVIFIATDEPIADFEHIAFRVDESDSCDFDNWFYVYGGQPPVLRVQYYSSRPNNFFAGAMMAVRDVLASRWDIDYDEVRTKNIADAAIEGYDLYIFEHEAPEVLPEDGVVLLADPDYGSENSGLYLGESVGGVESLLLAAGQPHPITKNLAIENMTVYTYRRLTGYDGYEPLVYCAGDPVILAKNEPDSKVFAMMFSLNYSNLPILFDFPLMISNLINYYMPSTLSEHVFRVGEEVAFNARGRNVRFTATNYELDYMPETVPGTFVPQNYGPHTVAQTLMGPDGREVSEQFFVQVPPEESNIVREYDELVQPLVLEKPGPENLDLIIYFAAALVALLFAEWWLQSREYF